MQRIFALGVDEDQIPGIWELRHPSPTLWVQSPHNVLDLFLTHSSRLIYCTGTKVEILAVEGKDPNEAPYGWDEVLHVPCPFFIKRTSGVVIGDSLVLLGGEKNPQEACQLDFRTETWTTLSPMREKRITAASVALDPHTLLVLGGSDLDKTFSCCESLDVRTGQWSPSFETLPVPLSGHAVTVYDDHVYNSGGWDGNKSRGEVWRSKVNGLGPWEALSSLNIERHNHGMMGDSVGGLSVVGGRQQTSFGSTEIVATETLSLDGGQGWATNVKLPFKKVWQATDMK
ncbi:unnamed protein product [Darwinula stevensoni]|uniref:Uncharacterized protein n=1 Tax=Darwinula stevensoni TaxID=69355 RepID=A0A7R9A7Z8_9CRUS|nr:unnamed protein product [Darwinula stevensoni]CAG0894268.1 unnamed protein product [Darwinula stevensoni]